MNSSFQIRRTTAILVVVIAALVGALVTTIGQTHQAPYTLATAHAATYENGQLTTFAPVLKHVMPAVVNIASTKVVKTQAGSNGMFDDPIFRQFFGGRLPQMPRERRAHALGSGVVVSQDGYILTNNHVVEDANQVKVTFPDKREYVAKVVGTDKATDVAVLKIDQHNLPVLPLSDSSRAQVGDVVLAIGNPFGLNGTVTMGIVSATGRSALGIERFEDFIQTDASINPGNSGGALINTRGELVGINTAILAGDSGGNQGIGFAIPINLARNVMDQIREHGKVTRGFIGILPQEITPDMAKAFGKQDLQGIAVAEVEPNSPASRAGLQVGDVITAINNNPVTDVKSFRLQVAGMAPGTNMSLKVFRNGSFKEMPLTLAEMSAKNLGDDEQGSNNPVPGNGEKGALKGVSVQALTSDLRQQLQIPEGTKGVIITDVDEDSAAADAGLHQGDIILQVNHKPVTTVQQFNAAVRQGDGSGSTLLLVNRPQQGTQFIVVPNK
jgi:Do/DeqQ family serine protease